MSIRFGEFKCRCCERQNNLRMLLKTNNSYLLKMLSAVAKISVEPDDNLPKCICSKCVEQLVQAYNFKKQCERTDTSLRLKIGEILPSTSSNENPKVKLGKRKNNTKHLLNTLNKQLGPSELPPETESSDQLVASLYECRHCGLCFSQATSLQKHFQSHISFKCEICSIWFKTSGDLLTHEKTHQLCTVCNKHFPGWESLHNHLQQNCSDFRARNSNETSPSPAKPGSSAVPSTIESSKNKRSNSCQIKCGSSLSSSAKPKSSAVPSTTASSKKKPSNSRQFECGSSPSSSAKPGSLAVPSTIASSKNKPSNSSQYECGLCTMTFQYTHTMKAHMNLHTNQCSVCRKFFLNKENLADHMKRHDKVPVKVIPSSVPLTSTKSGTEDSNLGANNKGKQNNAAGDGEKARLSQDAGTDKSEDKRVPQEKVLLDAEITNSSDIADKVEEQNKCEVVTTNEQSRDKEPTEESRDKEPTEQSRDKEPTEQSQDKEPTEQSRDKEPTEQSQDKEPTEQSRDKEPTEQSLEENTSQDIEMETNSMTEERNQCKEATGVNLEENISQDVQMESEEANFENESEQTEVIEEICVEKSQNVKESNSKESCLGDTTSDEKEEECGNTGLESLSSRDMEKVNKDMENTGTSLIYLGD